MNEEYMKMANSPIMWVACAIPIIWVIIQAVVYYKKSRSAALKMGIEDIKIKHATKSASIASIGPCFVMTTGCLAWILFVLFFANKMDKVNMVMAGGNKALIPALGAGAIIGCYSSLTVDRVFPIGPNIWAIIVSGGLMMILTYYNKKANKQWIKDWGTSLCMISGMISATIASML